jgi:putative Ca2+/H+ antiporter (TMEM165/GDT1 family)
VLATHLPGRQVVIGAWLAFLVQTVVAVLAGSVLQVFPVQPVRIAAGLGFLVFAALALRRDLKGELEHEQRDVQTGRGRRSPPWLASFLVVFAAEWGDLTQLATAGLVAHTGKPVEVGIGALAALWAVTVLAATLGNQMSRVLNPTLLNRLSAALFAAVGLIIIGSVLLPS